MADTGDLRLLWWGRELICSRAAGGYGRMSPAWGLCDLNSKFFLVVGESLYLLISKGKYSSDWGKTPSLFKRLF